MTPDGPTRILTIQEAHEACLRVGVDPQRIGRVPWRTEEQRRAIEAYLRAKDAENHE